VAYAKGRQFADCNRVAHVDHRDGELSWTGARCFVDGVLVLLKRCLIWILSIAQVAPEIWRINK
jgi:hypothetical protein